jgi:hypothetical protein
VRALLEPVAYSLMPECRYVRLTDMSFFSRRPTCVFLHGLFGWISCMVLCTGGPLVAQEAPKDPPTSQAADAPRDSDPQGFSLPSSDRLRIRFRLMAGYTNDTSEAALGFERQGRVGYGIFEAFGKLGPHWSYRFEVNPVNESQPLVACGETNFFFPNAPQSTGPDVQCSNDGRLRVDDYRSIALDTLMQQGPIRQAYMVYSAGPLAIRFGRFVQDVGFDAEEVGSLTAKDATHIQRIDAEANFGVRVSIERRRNGRRFVYLSAAETVGDGNRFHDYDYFYGTNSSLSTNSWPALVLAGAVEPVKKLEVRGAVKRGDTGSKVERVPNFYASKRNDNAMVFSARYKPLQNVSIFGEGVRYTWGLKASSAKMLGLDQTPVHKPGYYVGTDVFYPIVTGMRVGAVITHEELARDDALVALLTENGLYGVSRRKKERSTIFRVYFDPNRWVTIAVFRNSLSNPFPWISGIEPVSGLNAFKGRGNDKWGAVVRLRIE